MAGQSEVHPIKGACKHLRGRYRLHPSRRGPFPERELIRYECERARDITGEEDVDKCIAAVISCWQEQHHSEAAAGAPQAEAAESSS